MRFVCPSCRHVKDGQLYLAFLSPEGGALVCLACGQRHPVRQGLAQILPMGVELEPGPEQPSLLLELMQASREGPLQSLLAQQMRTLLPPILDMGCGCKDWGTAAIGLDLREELLRARGGVGVLADAAEPPFAPSSFRSVALLNLLDCVPNPLLVLAQADALLHPGGELLISMPAQWHEVVPERMRFDRQALLAGLQGDRAALGLSLDYSITQRWLDVPWPLALEGDGVRVLHAYVVRASKGALQEAS